MLEKHPSLAGKLRVVPHIALEWSVPATASSAAARQRLGIPCDVPVVLFFGSIRPYKGLETFVDAYLRARSIRQNLWIVIGGRPESRRLTLRAIKPLTSQAIIRLDYIPSDEVWLYHLAADVAVFPYNRASQSGALITAMSFSLPAIVTKVGGLPETVGSSGWSVPPDDPDELGRAILESVSDPIRLRRMGLKALQHLREGHAPERVAMQAIDFYQEVIRSCSGFFTSLTA